MVGLCTTAEHALERKYNLDNDILLKKEDRKRCWKEKRTRLEELKNGKKKAVTDIEKRMENKRRITQLRNEGSEGTAGLRVIDNCALDSLLYELQATDHKQRATV